MNKWRYVESGNDSEQVYQCLACGERFYLSSELYAWNYCPFCGTRWEGEHKCRPHNIPKWQYERFGYAYPHDLYQQEYTKQLRRDERSKWWLEHRIPGLATGWIRGQWWLFLVEPGSWRKVADYLSTERSCHPDNSVEYRAVVRRGD